MNTYKQGEIVLVSFPFSDLSQRKVRPVLIISNENYNKTVHDFIVCGLTTNLQDDRYSIIIDNNSLKKGNLKHKSRIKVDSITFLEKSLFVKPIGKVNDSVFSDVKSILNEIIE